MNDIKLASRLGVGRVTPRLFLSFLESHASKQSQKDNKVWLSCAFHASRQGVGLAVVASSHLQVRVPTVALGFLVLDHAMAKYFRLVTHVHGTYFGTRHASEIEFPRGSATTLTLASCLWIKVPTSDT